MKQPAIVRAGLDVGATELVVAILRDGQPESPCILPNTPAGHRALVKLFTRRGATARVVLEATGVYSLRLALASADPCAAANRSNFRILSANE